MLVHYAPTLSSWLQTRLARWGGDNKGGGCKRGWQRGDVGWGRLLTTYVAWALTDVLAANEVSKVGEMMMGVAVHHSQG